MPTGVKSLTGSYGSFAIRFGLIAKPAELPTSSV